MHSNDFPDITVCVQQLYVIQYDHMLANKYALCNLEYTGDYTQNECPT